MNGPKSLAPEKNKQANKLMMMRESVEMRANNDPHFPSEFQMSLQKKNLWNMVGENFHPVNDLRAFADKPH